MNSAQCLSLRASEASRKHRHRSTWINPDQAEEAIHAGSGRGIKVAVIDSGIELSHPTLRYARLVDDTAFEKSEVGIVTRSPNWGIDKCGHGTAIASVLYRIAPEVQIGSFRVMDHKNNTEYIIVEEAARLAIDLGYHILNCSFGCTRTNYENIKYFKPWIDAAYRHGVHVVSACSNDFFRKPEWPGHFPSVITVNMAKIDSDDLLFRWDVPQDPKEDFARHLVEFAAKGVDVELPSKNGGIRKTSGSSIAAPHVAGLLARLLSQYPHLKPPVAKSLLQEIAWPWEPSDEAFNG